MRPRARWAPKGRPARLRFAGGADRGASGNGASANGAGKGSGLRSVASAGGDAPGSPSPYELPDGYLGRHRRPSVLDEAGPARFADWTLLPPESWLAPPQHGPAGPSGDGTEPPGRPGNRRPPADRDAAAVREAVADERLRIARDLHDSVDKSLHGIALAAASLAASVAASRALDVVPSIARPAASSAAGPGILHSRLRELASLARYAISETRCVIYDLRDDTFAAPLGEVLRNLAAEWSAGSGVPVGLAVPPATDAASESRREIVAIAREALRNVETHAHATRARVSLRKAADRVLLTVSDNGVGFALPAGSRGLQAAGHYGLIGMTERARKLGGTLVIRSRPGHGTRIAVQVPANAADTAR